jgi:hypothetical protein
MRACRTPSYWPRQWSLHSPRTASAALISPPPPTASAVPHRCASQPASPSHHCSPFHRRSEHSLHAPGSRAMAHRSTHKILASWMPRARARVSSLLCSVLILCSASPRLASCSAALRQTPGSPVTGMRRVGLPPLLSSPLLSSPLLPSALRSGQSSRLSPRGLDAEASVPLCILPRPGTAACDPMSPPSQTCGMLMLHLVALF